jgi:uncharacterized protein (TIGR03083 family)
VGGVGAPRAVSVDVLALARAEQADLADLLETLTPEQWEAPSLCEGWTVRDVVAHVASYDGVESRDITRRLVRSRFRPNGANADGVAEFRRRPVGELVEVLRRPAGTRGLPPWLAGRVILTDTLVHHQDIRRPLGLPRSVPADRLRAALTFAVIAPPLRGFWHGRGVRVVAEDVDWSFGRGPEARGPGEAVLLALSARRGVAGELTGPGAAKLVERFG